MGKAEEERNQNQYVVAKRLVQNEAINKRELRAIANGLFPSLLPVYVEYEKSNVLLKSSIKGMLPLNIYFSGIVHKKMFLEVIYNIVRIAKHCEVNLMNMNNMMLELDCIFLDPGTKAVKCIFWPIVNNHNPVFPSEFFKDIPFQLVFNKHEDHHYVSTYLQYFNEHTSFSIHHFEKFILELMGRSGREEHRMGQVEQRNSLETTVLDEEDLSGTTVIGVDLQKEPSFPYLIRESNQERILVNKPSFRIGKERRYCDYFIANNQTVSRSHADIITRGDRYYIIDNNSTNKTFVDQRVIPVLKEIEIFSGTKIRLADEDFVFYI
ncbi:FHA domain-containing protein [Paucisalibacillus globulus]|uniref:FHA domain-containing protein n=1 Tax=Paucisalibacillus globulus TaxID=351095 RepID=UPI000BB82851|nr:FHA domain-containing protein [Paucisalibacillus globulus]